MAREWIQHVRRASEWPDTAGLAVGAVVNRLGEFALPYVVAKLGRLGFSRTTASDPVSTALGLGRWLSVSNCHQ